MLPTEAEPERRSSWPCKLLCAVLCGLILFGIGCRFYGLNWDEGAQLHPDERFCVSVVEKLRFPTSVALFFDSRVAPLNPANIPQTNYVYGQLPLFALKIAAQVTGTPNAAPLFLLGRFLAALVDTGTVFLTFLIARRFFETPKALFCAALVACAVLHIQQSHFFVVDPFAAFFITASFWAASRLVQKNRALDATLTGAFFGAALACKVSAALFGVALLGILVILGRRYALRRTIFCAFLAVFAAFLSFRVGHPMGFRGEFGLFDVRPDPRFWRDLSMQGAITSGIVDVPFNVQWIGRMPWLYSVRNLGFWGYSWPFLLSTAAGILILLRRPRGHGLLTVAAVFALVLLGIQGATFSKFTRYFLPLTPFCALLAAHAWRELEKKKPILRLGVPIVALSAGLWALAVTSIYGRTHTRIAASRWIEAHIAPLTLVANESAWDEGLPLGNVGVFTVYNTLDLDLHALDSPYKAASLAAKIDATEWIFISSGRGWQNIPRWPEKWPLTNEYYRALFDGRLGFTLYKRFDSFPRLGNWQFPDANVEEALTVYDHPLVLLFRKSSTYRTGQASKILEAAATPYAQNWQPNMAPVPDESSLPTPPGF